MKTLFTFFNLFFFTYLFSGITVSNREFCSFISSTEHVVRIAENPAQSTNYTNIKVVGGIFNASSVSIGCNLAPRLVSISNSKIEIDNLTLGICNDYTIEITIDWSSSTCFRKIIVESFSSHDFYVNMPKTPNSVYIREINDNEGYVCQSFTQGIFTSGDNCGYDEVTWTSSSSNGIPLTIANPTSFMTTISNFKPNAYYNVNATFKCNGGNTINKSITIITGAQCLQVDFSKLNDIHRVEYAIKEKEVQNWNENEIMDEDITLFPNPLVKKDLLKIKNLFSQKIISINIYNQSGIIVKKLNDLINYNHINISDLASGTYIIQFKLENMSLVTKQIIIIE